MKLYISKLLIPNDEARWEIAQILASIYEPYQITEIEITP